MIQNAMNIKITNMTKVQKNSLNGIRTKWIRSLKGMNIDVIRW